MGWSYLQESGRGQGDVHNYEKNKTVSLQKVGQCVDQDNLLGLHGITKYLFEISNLILKRIQLPCFETFST